MSLTVRAAEYAANLAPARLPPEVREKARQALRDHLACTLAGSQTDLGRMVRETLAAGVDGPAALVGAERGTAPGLAAYCNATAANALDCDDTSSAGHPGASLIPAALAAAAVQGCSGATLLAAVVAGYEVGMRVARAIRPSWQRYRQVHGIGSAQVFGAAAAAGRVLGLDPEQMARAFGIAGATAPVAHAGKFGWDERPLGWVKDNCAWPAEAGLRAALLARAGFPASRSILDGDTGFWVMAGSDQFDPSHLEDYSQYRLLGLSFKPYPCCRWLHTTLDALARLQSQRGFTADDVLWVRVDAIQPLAELFADPAPRTMVDAQFSVPHAVAMQLLGVPIERWWRPENRTELTVVDLMGKVQVAHDPTLTELYLARGRHNGIIPARVRVALRAGGVGEAYEEVATGEPSRALSEEAQLDKFHRLAGLAWPLGRRQDLLRLLAELEALPSASQLLEVLLLVQQRHARGGGQTSASTPVRYGEGS